MKKISSAIFFLIFFVSAYAGNPDSGLTVIPKPVQIIKGTGFANITAQWKIYIPKVEWTGEAEIFNDFLKKNYGFSLPVLNSIPKGKNCILLQKAFGDFLSKDSYSLSARQNKISIIALEPSGIF